LGEARFAREFLCRPLSDEASLFPSKLFEGGVRVPYVLGLPASYWEERGMIRYTGVDFALSASAGADWTVIYTVAVDENGVRWLANMRRGKGWGFQRQIDEIKEEYALMRPDVIHAEANQFQRIFSDEVVRTTDIPIRKFFTAGVQPKQPWRKGMTSITLGKHHLDRGVPSLRMSLENKKWRIPRGDAHSIELTDIWIGEMNAMSFQNGQVISVGEHDDTVMASWICDSAVRLGGFRFSFGEDQTDQVKPTNLLPPPGQEAPAVAAPAAKGPVEPLPEPIANPDPGTYVEPDGRQLPHEGSPRAEDILGGWAADPFSF
jgi:hypothetical protein